MAGKRTQSPQPPLRQWLMACGGTVEGELGLGGTEDHIVRVLRSIPSMERIRIEQVASGRNHTLILSESGQVYSCGSNSHGQLGRPEVGVRKPEIITTLYQHKIVQVACGEQHSMALSEAGQVFVWGANNNGQLGDPEAKDAENRGHPRIVKKLGSSAVQIASGSNHCLALANNGTVFAWGSNQCGQLGLGTAGNYVSTPQDVLSLQGVPLSQIVCGGQHSMVLSKSGTLLVWGSNRHGQLGLGDTVDRASPAVVKPLRQHGLKYISAGEEHSAVLTADGGVFTFGSGTYGQLGHGCKADQPTPRKIMDLMGTIVTQIATGRCHTICYAPGPGRIYTFGLGGSGQLGIPALPSSVATPTQLPGKWIQALEVKLIRPTDPTRRNSNEVGADWSQCLNDEFQEANKSMVASPIDAAGSSERSWNERINVEVPKAKAARKRGSQSDERPDAGNTGQVRPGSGQREPGAKVKKAKTKVDQIGERLALLPEKDPAEILKTEMLVFAIFAGGDRTFIISHEPRKYGVHASADYRVRPKRSQIRTINVDILETMPHLKRDESVPQATMDNLEGVLSSLACMNGSFLTDQDRHYDCSGYNHGVDTELALRAMKCLEDTKNSSLKEMIRSEFERLVASVYAMSQRPVDIEAMRIYVLIPMSFLFQKVPDFLETITNPFQRALLRLKSTASKIVSAWYSQYNEHVFGDFVRCLKNVIDHVLMYNRSDTISMELALKTLKQLNSINRSKLIVPFEEFYIEILSQHISIEKDYMEWQMSSPELRARQLFFCDYPFVFDAQAKTTILTVDAAIQKHTAIQQSMNQSLNPFAVVFRQQQVNPFLILKVDRDRLIEDSLRQLSMKDCADLRKPLKVIFDREDAVDEGGVRKEFFMLLIEKILSPDFGIFKVYSESNYMWFNPSFFNEDKQTIFLIGILCGLAIYNQTIIPLPFPLALYKKLLKEPVTFRDLEILSPQVAKNLKDLLNHKEDDIEEVYCLNFTIARDNYGLAEEVELKDGGSNISVNLKNRQEYVDLYVDWIFNKSCFEMFALFANGFYRVLKSEILSLFNANELMTLVAGKENYDWKDLQLHTGYKDEYNPDHPVIRMFWKVFHDLKQSEKKDFLRFVTGSDRIPLLGMGEIKMVVIPYRASTVHLPVAHTCTNTLELPKYESETVLKEKLITAISHHVGFGIR
ncbi:probable E3 ubiquitin-protein ligase HERC4 isoform X2 [Varroa destructor]|uniref:HECT domain-containing protein n=1 Tax=Varroa destructor TaxID=109461 RepID=A0A7M7JLJ9_VARDE|nr:probable E3 ubiquitin-protein ligase HERC4 isoform X2 [Varroa destructor]